MFPNHTTEGIDLFKQTYLNPHMSFVEINESMLTVLLDVINEMYTNDEGEIDD